MNRLKRPWQMCAIFLALPLMLGCRQLADSTAGPNATSGADPASPPAGARDLLRATPTPSPPSTQAAEETALRFTRALAQRDYARAYALTTAEYQARTSVHDLQTAFGRIIPLDWGPIDLQLPPDAVLESWPDKQPADVGWVYIGLEGKVYSYGEAVNILIAQDGKTLKVRDVEFGRP